MIIQKKTYPKVYIIQLKFKHFMVPVNFDF